MTGAAVDEALRAAKQQAAEQWRLDIAAARQRFTDTIRAAEAAYERDRVKQAA